MYNLSVSIYFSSACQLCFATYGHFFNICSVFIIHNNLSLFHLLLFLVIFLSTYIFILSLGCQRVLQVPPVADAEGADQDTVPLKVQGERLPGTRILR